MQPKQPPSLGRLARRISAWTTNCLISVMLVVVAVGFGYEVLHWWHEDGASPAAGTSPGADPLGDGTVPHVLQFGDQGWSIRQQEFSGRPGDVRVALQAVCRTAITNSRPRGESPDTAEQELLERLAHERPLAEEFGQWRIYQWGTGHPVLIGTRAVRSGEQGAGGAPGVPACGSRVGEQGPGRAKAHTTAGTRLADTPYRVVIWGVAVPAAANSWTLYLFQSGGMAGDRQQPADEVPLPPGGHRLVSIRAEGGAAITAFLLDEGGTARAFYDGWFADHGWTVAAGWQPIASAWHARFELPSYVPPRAVDIRLGADSQGRWTGLIMESQSIRGKP